jgi:hypothetical protein
MQYNFIYGPIYYEADPNLTIHLHWKTELNESFQMSLGSSQLEP